MDETYKEAFYEVDCILNLMPKELTDKIPNAFKTVIEENKSKSYFKVIKEPINEQELKDETITILGMIYKDFLKKQFQNVILAEDNTRNVEISFRDNNKVIENNQALSVIDNEK